MSDFYIGRQPILDDRGRIYAYELLFRSHGSSASAAVTDNTSATARVLINMLQNFGIERLLGGKKGFINTDESLIMDGAIDLLPKELFVIEVLETTKLSRQLLDKIKYYISKGYVFAMDDLEFTKDYFDRYRELIPMVHYIKVDYMLADKNTLEKNVSIIKGLKAKMLAEKVETNEDFEKCKGLGFDLFQGYFFAKPVVMSQKSVDPSKAAIIQLINMLRGDAEATELEKVIKHYPELYINLLKFMNSSAFFTKGTITSIKHAMAMLGRANLTKWLYLMLYADPKSDTFNNPLLETAQLRGKTMEMLCQTSKVIGNKSDSAFMVGLMSLLDAIFNRDIREVMNEFNVDDEIKLAVTEHRGELGLLLKTVKCFESDDVCELVDCFGILKISFEDFNRIMMECYDWTDSFAK
ncbi:EAL and HDOD domain-containing protein [Seleniivibrio woodruffii]|uniref:EAL and modified HD-GYP domain-containing signal transduction protein n=2 Tax=Seleniivibrio woodruffii TaxID=1078050 RepID=A0A4R1KEQ9_9BACT|nr:EAL domain-containing protein [Seleniivibrio woodruffii]TCK61759.1 EAL and modified HD-GYP domain-containing signal transduction protein [Seleniivibrio woodruffii]TVZ35126.1 EAL and modified HD-GYP domain-containing signal transduction protein [Seleniivibrio woodruffii]